jgi:eukaryotic-like serine/threonine-protein kinase
VTNGLEKLRAALAGRYEITRELGRGGMATVYLANDLGHDREVAIKVLLPDLGMALGPERFRREIQLATKISHPNILALYDSGETPDKLLYYVMPFIPGESLRARLDHDRQLSVDEAVQITIEVASALDYAHRNGIVHRDIKPENILLSGGAAVVTDFGIAKAIDASRTVEGGTTGITRAGVSLGTPAYMAPEQALGDPATDHHADIYSWGVVAWELLGGAHPFAQKTTAQALIAAHVAEAAPSLALKRPEVPEPLARLVMRCLDKNPANRPASAAELLVALESVNTSGEKDAPVPASRQTRAPRRSAVYVAAAVLLLAAIAAGIVMRRRSGAAVGAAATVAPDKSLAVLPFIATGNDTTTNYLGEGIADEVSQTLGQVPGLRISGRSSAAHFARTGAAPQEVAKSLGVGVVLDGTVRRVGDRVRVAAELTNGGDGAVIWRESYERAANDILSVQDEIARAIAGQLQVTLSGAGASASGGTRDPTAYDLYLKGMYRYRRRGPGIAEGIADLEQATVRDSNFARAWAGLSIALIVSPSYLETRISDVLPRGRRAAERAVRLDSTLSEAHEALGYAYAESFDWANAEAEMRRAIALDPGAAEPRFRLGYLMLNTFRPEEALPVLQQAKARDPMYFLISSYLGTAEIELGHVAEGVAEEQRGLELEPDNVAALSLMTGGYRIANMPDSAKAISHRLLALPGIAARRGIAAYTLAIYGDRRDADSLIAVLEALPERSWTRSTALATAYLGVGDTTRAIAYMERAAAGDGDLLVLYGAPLAENIVRNARTDAVWRRFHLDPALLAKPLHASVR